MVELQMCCEADTANELRSTQHHITRTAQYTASQQTNCAVDSIKHGKFKGNYKINGYIGRGTDDTHSVAVTQ
jgi:hypothetical protein